MQYVWLVVNNALHYASQLDRQQWMYVLIFVVSFGIFCMRGFGRRL